MQLNKSETIKIGENEFYIRPFPAMKAANISGEVIGFITPMLGAILPLFDGKSNGQNTDLNSVAPMLTTGFESLSGDKCESLLRKLILNEGNVAVRYNGKAERLTNDIMNDIFCGEIQDMYILAWEVIKLNFGGFFKKLGSLSGNVAEQETMTTK